MNRNLRILEEVFLKWMTRNCSLAVTILNLTFTEVGMSHCLLGAEAKRGTTNEKLLEQVATLHVERDDLTPVAGVAVY